MLTGPCDILCYLRNLFHYSDLLQRLPTSCHSNRSPTQERCSHGLSLHSLQYPHLAPSLPQPRDGSRHTALQCLSATSSARRDTVCLQLSCTQVTLGSSKGTVMHQDTLINFSIFTVFSSSFPHFLPVPLMPALYYAGLQPSCSKFISTEWRFCTRLAV